jgi:hypothetical protein
MSAVTMSVKKKTATDKPRREVAKRITVSESNLRKAASRLLTSALVSTEVQYVQRVLGNTATQEDIDSNVMAVRKLPWSSIVVAD